MAAVAGATGSAAGVTTRFKDTPMRLKTGQYVRHSRFGWGTVMEYNRELTMVYFNTVGVKRLATSSTKFGVVGRDGLKKKPVA